jgi:DNA-binding HxlR family transcriptional regulator
MTEQPEDKTREQIARFLPDALARALRDYEELTTTEQSVEESKKVAAQYSAYKAAIAHIELLIKLAKWAGLPDSQTGGHNMQIVLKALLEESEEQIARDRDAYEEEED